MSQPSSATADRAVNLAYAALMLLMMPAIGWLVSPSGGDTLLQVFLGYSGVLLGFYSGLHFMGAMCFAEMEEQMRRRWLLGYLLLLPLAGWLTVGSTTMMTVLLSLAGWTWAYLAAIFLAGPATMSGIPDWLLRIRQRMAWTTAVCHLIALGWLARGDFLAG